MSLIRFTLVADTELGGHFENVFTYQTDEEVDEANAVEVLNDFDSYLLGEALATLIEEILDIVTFNEIRLEKNTDVPDDTWVLMGTKLITTPGQYAGTAPLPEFIAARVQAAISGPGRKGSKFIGGLDEGQWSTSAWYSNLLVALADFAIHYADTYIGAFTGIAYSPGVFQKIGDVGQGFVDFTGSILVDSTASHQNRREAGLGI